MVASPHTDLPVQQNSETLRKSIVFLRDQMKSKGKHSIWI